MTEDNPAVFRSSDARAVAERIVAEVGTDLRVALPLGLGKPVALTNALTQLAIENPTLRLSIFTALTLERPEPSNDMEHRFLGPSMDRLFGRYPQLDYARLLRDETLPSNINVNEFFLLAGRWLGVDEAQQSYISVNFTHALDVLVGQRPNVIMQLVAREDDRLSLSCNTDITVDLLKLRDNGELDFLMAGEINAELPFMGGQAELPADAAALLLEEPDGGFELFSAPNQPVSLSDYAIGLHVSRMVRDGGTLQLGIGGVGDAVAQALILRHRGEIEPLWERCPFPRSEKFAETGAFETGLYSVSEMLVEGLLVLAEEGVIRREVDGALIHAGFYIENRDFYRKLREMPSAMREKIAMVPVSFTNSLYGDEQRKRAVRKHARFINSAMKATLMGAVASDATEEGQVVSGVGGQFNFVDQALALEGARSIITLPSTREDKGETVSNIVWSYGNITVPRHMRDIVVTEYGIADLRGRADAEVIAAMLSIADSRFQDELLDKAKHAGKIHQDYRIADACRANTPQAVERWLGGADDSTLPRFPFGTDFSTIEIRLLPALEMLKHASASHLRLAGLAKDGWFGTAVRDEATCLERMKLAAPTTLSERITSAALRGALRRTER